jgi:hypothetical protein
MAALNPSEKDRIERELVQVMIVEALECGRKDGYLALHLPGMPERPRASHELNCPNPRVRMVTWSAKQRWEE